MRPLLGGSDIKLHITPFTETACGILILKIAKRSKRQTASRENKMFWMLLRDGESEGEQFLSLNDIDKGGFLRGTFQWVEEILVNGKWDKWDEFNP